MATPLTCEWPRRAFADEKCGNKARTVVTAPGHQWSRTVCGVHERRAVNLGWSRPGSGNGCPDNGWCHHDCTESCFRVRLCAPLSAVYHDDDWPESIVAQHNAMHEQRPGPVSIDEIIARGAES